jgi:hypothetical protein
MPQNRKKDFRVRKKGGKSMVFTSAYFVRAAQPAALAIGGTVINTSVQPHYYNLIVGW